MSDSNRSGRLAAADSSEQWDVVILGAGATGIGAALEAASRGLRTLVVDRGDYSGGTSSRSTKLIHGGVRYLRQGNVSVVFSALKERARLVRNAPHLVHDLSLLVPGYRWWEVPYYGIGLGLYDLLAGRNNLKRSNVVGRRGATQALSTLRPEKLRGGVVFHDGQFDDSRLALCLARSAEEHGAVALNYVEGHGFLKERRRIVGVRLRDRLTGKQWEVRSRVVINAAGPFADFVRRTDDSAVAPSLVVSQGSHIVVSSAFLPGNTALLVPSTDDGRVIFAIPWHGHVVIGTTDEKRDLPETEPRPTIEEIDYLIEHVQRYLTRPMSRDDVLSAWAGLRALALAPGKNSTSALSRDHAITVSESGLVSAVGGKWTTYRKMGVDIVNRAVEVGGLPRRASVTKNMRLHGWSERQDRGYPRSQYGSELQLLEQLEAENPSLSTVLHPALPYTESQVVFACRYEHAAKVEDVLSRRTRALFLNADAALECSGRVASLMAEELGWTHQERAAEEEAFAQLASTYQVLPKTT